LYIGNTITVLYSSSSFTLQAAAAAMCMESDTTDAAAFVSVARALCQVSSSSDPY
jgi:hypothetical protein